MQAAQLLVEIDETGGDAGEATFALVGRVCDINSVRYGLEKTLKSTLRCALFGQLVKRLFGLDDLLFRFGGHVDLGRLGADVAAQLNEVAAHGEIIDHLRVVADRKGADRSTRQPREIGGAAQFPEPLVIFHERLERHRAREIVLGDARSGDVEDARMHRVVEVIGGDDGRDPVVDVVIGQDRAQQLLLGLDGVGHGLGILYRHACWIDRCDLVHAPPLLDVPSVPRCGTCCHDCGGLGKVQ